ncbi:hypothetical protein NT2_03_00680 [Caenibius tardaugens NBRC 16725]|uniref:DUF1214 domain-containing protein n=1 Tax=Caenibius tardaugens NBRC 16725 TaxID=1219035 RepID=U2YJG5_9SPHN|nr:DUF1214 domain-containing protein [Caenibius tardaugens]AZI35027.1 DUF1214 domain-containing protein [Caenibius tardaugens NBRC 16725]GAD48580.1 hypothetical protein NT2_03_00680 [Caenibius tardaugens NBRC 16725]
MTNDIAANRVLTGKAWDDFCETVRLTGHEIDRWGDVPNDLDRTEWYRHLSRLLRNGLERFVENSEPDHPRLRDTPFRCSINAQTPDQDHLLSEWYEPGHSYRVWGNRGTLPYFVMAAWKASQDRNVGAQDWADKGADSVKEFDPAMLYTTDFLQSDAVQFDADGNFEIICSPEKPADGRDWLKIDDDTVGLLIRLVHQDRDKEVAPTFQIERLDNPKQRPVKPEELATNLARAAQMVRGYAELERTWWFDNLATRANQLQFSRTVYLSNGGVADRHHAFGMWDKPKDMALVFHFATPPAEYWIFQLLNIFQENLDTYEHKGGYINGMMARHEADGTVRVVISEENPGIGGNWIDSFGHVHGTMSLRFIKCAVPPEVASYCVPLAELKANGWAALTDDRAIHSGQLVE